MFFINPGHGLNIKFIYSAGYWDIYEELVISEMSTATSANL